ncbi:MAG: hypothetical protein LAT80_03920, partial [Balneolaceae bacterium]|nr:hypothetical protein [Balneolaceae bacterium]
VLTASLLLITACGDEESAERQALSLDGVQANCGELIYAAIANIPETRSLFENHDESMILGQSASGIAFILDEESRRDIESGLQEVITLNNEGRNAGDFHSIAAQIKNWCLTYSKHSEVTRNHSQEAFIGALEATGLFSELFDQYYTAPHFRDEALSPIDRAGSLSSASSIQMVNDWVTTVSKQSDDEREQVFDAIRTELEAL